MERVYSGEQRREIAGRARTIRERLEGPPNEPGAEPPIGPARILSEWRDRYPNEETFRRRLERSGWTADAVREQLAATRWPADEPLPGWIDDLERLIRHVETSTPPDPDDGPFGELLGAVADFAREELPDEIVAHRAVAPLVEDLVDRLERLCVRPLYVEFKSFVEYHDPELARADPDTVSEPTTTYYDRFVDAMFAHGFENLCAEYPVLGRQLVSVLRNWTDAVTEVWTRLRADRDALGDRFGVDGDVVALEPLSEDTHANGRVPIRVSFDSSAVVYKPRPVDGGATLYAILGRLDEHLSTPSIEPPAYLRRDGYGWMEAIEYDDLPDEAAVARYYERAGAVLCTAYALNATDVQHENLIVDGDAPAIVDGETVFHPHVRPTAQPAPTEVAAVVDESVLLTLLLPWSVRDSRNQRGEGLGAAIAGLGDESGRTTVEHRTRPSIEAVNTDVMAVGETTVEIDGNANTPRVEGADRPPGRFVDALVRGFEATHETICELHADGRFFGDVVPPELVDGVESRLLYRPTARYGSILGSTTGRDPLRDGARLSLEFERLAVPFFDGRIEADDCWPLYRAERRALLRRDIPRFSARADGRRLVHDGVDLGVSADASGYERCRDRVDSMDARDRAHQTWLIRSALGSSPGHETGPAASSSPEATDDAATNTARPSDPSPATTARSRTAERSRSRPTAPPDERFETEARELFDAAMDSAVRTPDRDRWLSILPSTAGIDLVPTDPSLYDGRGGLAVTAAALHVGTGEPRYRRAARRTLEPVVERIEDGRPPEALGGVVGIGSVAYAFAVCAELLDDERYRTVAAAAAAAATDERLAADETFDVVGGAAGTLLGLLAFHDRFGGADVLERAIACGDRLLEARVETRGRRVWETTADGPPITGFSHGQSGIAYALARLASTTGDTRFAAASREALDFESTLYDPSRSNWARSHADDRYVDQWCHGRAGMGLARLEIGTLLGDDDVRARGEAALAETATAGLSSDDHLCCGNVGRAEALLEGARRGAANRSDAVALAQRVLVRRRADGVLALPGHSETFVNHTLFMGVSGVAYTLLRLHRPDALPSVLLLE